MIYELGPFEDERWPDFLERDSRATVFHTRGWLRALRDTYGFVPVVITTCAPGTELENGIVFCRVHSWLTGRRLVSLPYSDHCEPLMHSSDMEEVTAWIVAECRRLPYRYVEMRPLRASFSESSALKPNERFIFHSLDLSPDTEHIFAAFDKKCVQNRIRHASKEDLEWEQGQSESLLADFYRLMVVTRQRHELPPQPIQWYRNLIRCFGRAVTIHLLRQGNQPVAGLLTIGYKQTLIAKYSCSDLQFKSTGATPLLFWKVIEEAKRQGYLELDLGRCNLDDEGLAKFKTRLGAHNSELVYWRHANKKQVAARQPWMFRVAAQVFSRMPESLLSTSGRLLYKHFG